MLQSATCCRADSRSPNKVNQTSILTVHWSAFKLPPYSPPMIKTLHLNKSWRLWSCDPQMFHLFVLEIRLEQSFNYQNSCWIMKRVKFRQRSLTATDTVSGLWVKRDRYISWPILARCRRTGTCVGVGQYQKKFWTMQQTILGVTYNYWIANEGPSFSA